MYKAIIFGIDGQDGSYLAEFLLEKEYQVVGWIPGNSPVSLNNIQHILDRITLVEGSLADSTGLVELVKAHQPREVYNLASPSSPSRSWNDPVMVGEYGGIGVTRLLEAIRGFSPQTRFYQASTSEIFGDPVESPQNEQTPFNPRNPYGIAKLYAHLMTIRYRDHYGIHAVCGILYNHESPRRGVDFVTRKIVRQAVRIKFGLEQELRLGNLDAKRDWGFAGDYIRAMWMMLQQDSPRDFVIGTGQAHSIRDFCQLVFATLDLNYQDWVVFDERFYQPAEQNTLIADPRDAMNILGWRPQVSLEQLVMIMVDAEKQFLAA